MTSRSRATAATRRFRYNFQPCDRSASIPRIPSGRTLLCHRFVLILAAAFGDVIAPNDAWDLVHFLRVLQINRHSGESDVLRAAGGTIPPYVEKSLGAFVNQPESGSVSGENR